MPHLLLGLAGESNRSSYLPDTLRQNGRLYLVALRNLPYEDALNEAFGTVRMAADDGAFRVCDARDPIPAKARAARLERQKRPR